MEVLVAIEALYVLDIQKMILILDMTDLLSFNTKYPLIFSDSLMEMLGHIRTGCGIFHVKKAYFLI